LRVEVILVRHLHGNVGSEQAQTGSQGQEETYSDAGRHRLG
jgi:hypothetical protein